MTWTGYLERYRATLRRKCAGLPLEHEVSRPRGGTFSLRWIYLHVIEEYARHCGHPDLIRERIDGATGE